MGSSRRKKPVGVSIIPDNENIKMWLGLGIFQPVSPTYHASAYVASLATLAAALASSAAIFSSILANVVSALTKAL